MSLRFLLLAGVSGIGIGGCGMTQLASEAESTDAKSSPSPERFAQLYVDEEEGWMEEAADMPVRAAKKSKNAAPQPSAAAPAAPPPPEPAPAGASDDSNGEDGAPTRAWFPETFLFQPEVVTDAEGRATVSARVPDRLTTWRVLALAHDRSGHQAGDVTRFTSSLPLYADPVIPASLRVGDRVRMAIPIINTTETSRTVDVTVSAEGLDIRGGGTIRVPSLGSAVARAEVAAVSPGEATVKAELRSSEGMEDAVVHSIPIVPRGQRHAVVRTGTLGAPRTVDLPLPDGVVPTSAEVRLTVVPGGLGVMQSELASVAGRGADAESASLSLSVAALAPQVWATAGLPVSATGADPEATARHDTVRTLRLLGVQQAMRLPVNWDLPTALALTAGASQHPGDAILARLTDRGIDALIGHQRPDGTFGGDLSGSWTIQRMLVATAMATDAVRRAAASDPQSADERRRRIAPLQVRSRGAAERYAGRVTDPYTAAALIVADLVEGETRSRMVELVRAGLKEDEQGRVVEVPKGVLRADGRAPAPPAAAALAARALAAAAHAEDASLIADLGATVLAAYRPGAGWGDAPTDRVCLQAIADLWAAPPAEAVTLTLTHENRTMATRVLSVADLRNPIFVSVPSPGAGAWTLSAAPAVPGLAFSLEQVSYAPWTRPPRDPGIDVELALPPGARVGQTSDLVVDIASLPGTGFDLHLHLPAGVQADADRVSVDGALPPSAVEQGDGFLRLSLPPLLQSRVTVTIPVTPTLAGTLWSGSTDVVDRVSGATTVIPPSLWRVGG